MFRYIFFFIFGLILLTACSSTQDLSDTIKNKATEVGNKNPLSRPGQTSNAPTATPNPEPSSTHLVFGPPRDRADRSGGSLPPRPTRKPRGCRDDVLGSRLIKPSGISNSVLARIVKDDEIDRYAELHRRNHKIVGLGLGIVYDGQIVYLAGYGHENRELEIPVSATDTMFRWGSISKTITATAALTLVEDGFLDLDRDIREYYPEYTLPNKYMSGGLEDYSPLPEDTTITMRMLLGHQSGIQHHGNGAVDPKPDESLRNDPAINTGFLWAFPLWEDAPLLFLPNQQQEYSDYGINLAGVVMGSIYNDACGFDWEPDEAFTRLVSTRIVRPYALGLRPDYKWEDIPHRAIGYEITASGDVIESGGNDYSWTLPAGGYISSIADMASFCNVLASDDLLNEESKTSQYTSQRTSDGSISEYSLGLYVSSRGGNPQVSHGGKTAKGHSILILYPEDDICLVATANTLRYPDIYPVDLRALSEGIEDILRERLSKGDSAIINDLF